MKLNQISDIAINNKIIHDVPLFSFFEIYTLQIEPSIKSFFKDNNLEIYKKLTTQQIKNIEIELTVLNWLKYINPRFNRWIEKAISEKGAWILSPQRNSVTDVRMGNKYYEITSFNSENHSERKNINDVEWRKRSEEREIFNSIRALSIEEQLNYKKIAKKYNKKGVYNFEENEKQRADKCFNAIIKKINKRYMNIFKEKLDFFSLIVWEGLPKEQMPLFEVFIHLMVKKYFIELQEIVLKKIEKIFILFPTQSPENFNDWLDKCSSSENDCIILLGKKTDRQICVAEINKHNIDDWNRNNVKKLWNLKSFSSWKKELKEQTNNPKILII